ncbi:MAG: hypothetical protein V1816_13155 [Pseudomonadota bacterium]
MSCQCQCSDGKKERPVERPGECTPEQILKCHGAEKDHSRVGDKKD